MMESDLSPEAFCDHEKIHNMKENCQELKGIPLVLIARGYRGITPCNILNTLNSSNHKFFYLPLRPLLP